MDKKILLQHISDSLAERGGISKRKADNFLRSFFDLIETGLTADGIVKVKSFGTTKIVSVNNRESVNITTGERFQIEGHDKVSFTPDAMFRDLVNRPFAHFSTVILDEDFDEADLEPMQEVDDFEADEMSVVAVDTQTNINADNGVVPAPSAGTTDTDGANQLLAGVASSELISEAAATTDDVVLPEAEASDGEAAEAPVDDTPNPYAADAVETEVTEVTTPVAPATVTPSDAPLAEDCTTTESDKCMAIADDDSPSHNEDNMQTPIIINNTIPESHTNRWRIAFGILATLVLMTLSYFAGYFRIFCPCGETPATAVIASEDTVGSNVEAAKADTAAVQPAAKAEKAAAPDSTDKVQPAENDERAAAKDFRQMENGDYLITGILETHEMKVGDNLFKLAKKAYGDKDLASYIIFHNNIDNPDLVQLGQKIEIPRLLKK